MLRATQKLVIISTVAAWPLTHPHNIFPAMWAFAATLVKRLFARRAWRKTLEPVLLLGSFPQEPVLLREEFIRLVSLTVFSKVRHVVKVIWIETHLDTSQVCINGSCRCAPSVYQKNSVGSSSRASAQENSIQSKYMYAPFIFVLEKVPERHKSWGAS